MDPNIIFSTLRDEIESGALVPGSVLKQELIAERFEVSRQPVRHALTQLLGSGLVVRRPDRSLAVAAISERDATELSELRAILEIAALDRSAPTLTAAVLRRAERLNAELSEEDDPARIEELDRQFHRVLYRGCENARLLTIVDALRREARRAHHSQGQGTRARVDFFNEHAAILSACAAGDFAAAGSLLRHHLVETTAKLLCAPTEEPS